MNNNDGNENRNANLNSGNYSENIGRDYNDNRQYHNYSPKEAFKPIKDIPKLGSKNFVGRQDELASVCHCDSERGSNLTDSFLLEMLGLLPWGRNDRFRFCH